MPDPKKNLEPWCENLDFIGPPLRPAFTYSAPSVDLATLSAQVINLGIEIEAIKMKLDTIFGSHALVDGRWVDFNKIPIKKP